MGKWDKNIFEIRLIPSHFFLLAYTVSGMVICQKELIESGSGYRRPETERTNGQQDKRGALTEFYMSNTPSDFLQMP